MGNNLTAIEKMCRSFDSDKKKPILSQRNAASALVTFKDGARPSVYCPLLGERTEEGNTTTLEYYCTADDTRKIVCPYTKRYGE